MVVAPIDTLSVIYCSTGIWFETVIGGLQTNSLSETHLFLSLYHKLLMTQRDILFLWVLEWLLSTKLEFQLA